MQGMLPDSTVPMIDKAGKDICLNCPYPYCYGGIPGACSPKRSRRPSYERQLYEDGKIGDNDVYDDQ